MFADQLDYVVGVDPHRDSHALADRGWGGGGARERARTRTGRGGRWDLAQRVAPSSNVGKWVCFVVREAERGRCQDRQQRTLMTVVYAQTRRHLNIPIAFVDIRGMASHRQRDANRRNAQKSTGPRTVEGKRKVALNAVKHGLLSEQVVLPNEDEHEFVDFRRRLKDALSPVGELEEMLLGTIAASAWRLRRVIRVERGLFVAYIAENARPTAAKEDEERVVHGTISVHMGDVTEESAKAAEAERRADEAEQQARAAEQRAKAAERLLEETDAMRAAGDAEVGRAFMADAEGIDAFSRLSRYEAHIQRSMFKALEELRRLQAARRAMHSGAAPPELKA